MSDDPKRRAYAAAERAADPFERQQQIDRRIADGEKRRSDMLAKTARLRKQLLLTEAGLAGP